MTEFHKEIRYYTVGDAIKLNNKIKEEEVPGNKLGGIKARNTNIERHGEDFYKRIGAKGGRNGRGPNYKGGFAGNRELARLAGMKGGRISRRGKAKKNDIQ